MGDGGRWAGGARPVHPAARVVINRMIGGTAVVGGESSFSPPPTASLVEGLHGPTVSDKSLLDDFHKLGKITGTVKSADGAGGGVQLGEAAELFAVMSFRGGRRVRRAGEEEGGGETEGIDDEGGGGGGGGEATTTTMLRRRGR